jgi:hypothetical protein
MKIVTFSSRSIVSGRPERKDVTARIEQRFKEQEEADRKAAALRNTNQQAASTQ